MSIACQARAYEGKDPFILVLSARRDVPLRDTVCELLAAGGYRVWYPKDDVTASIINEKLSACCGLAAVYTSGAVMLHDFRKTLTAAALKGKPLLAFLSDDVQLSPGMAAQLGSGARVEYAQGMQLPDMAAFAPARGAKAASIRVVWRAPESAPAFAAPEQAAFQVQDMISVFVGDEEALYGTHLTNLPDYVVPVPAVPMPVVPLVSEMPVTEAQQSAPEQLPVWSRPMEPEPVMDPAKDTPLFGPEPLVPAAADEKMPYEPAEVPIRKGYGGTELVQEPGKTALMEEPMPGQGTEFIETEMLKIIRLDNGCLFECADAVVTVGRKDHCSVTLPEMSVSGDHVMIRPASGGGEMTVKDMDSTNGTKVNGRKLEKGGSVRVKGDTAFLHLGTRVACMAVAGQTAEKLRIGVTILILTCIETQEDLLYLEGEHLVGRMLGEEHASWSEIHISWEHARLCLNGAAASVEDVGSSNGTSVNGCDIRHKGPIVLHDKDEIRMGLYHFAVRLLRLQ